MESALILVCMFLWSGASVAEPGVVGGLTARQISPPNPGNDGVYRYACDVGSHSWFSGGVTVTVGDNRISGREELSG